MIRNRSLRKTVAYALIAAMLNPAAILPAYALDTDIFLNPPTGSVFGEPNIMIVLDTSDSMWIPEPWHEVLPDEAAYDSHYEYLWNDTAFIHSIGCNVAGCAGGGDAYTNASKNLPRFPDYDAAMASMPQGFFAGDTAAARGTLKQTANNWAAGTTAGDPGPRNLYRNYGGGVISNVAAAQIYDSSWVYWLPAGTPDTDLRLMSTSPSRAPLGSRISRFSNSNGINNDPVTRGGIQYGNAADNAFDNFNLVTFAYRQGRSGANRCTSSYSQLLPSTVYAPGPYAKNSGIWLNKQWVRYEQFLGLDNSRVTDFPSRAAGDSARAQWVLAPYWSGTMETSPNHLGFAPATAPMIDHNFGPIRTQQVSSYSGWTTLRTDLAGYIPYRDWSFNPGDTGANNTVLINTLAAFGITSNDLQARVRSVVKTFETGAHAVSTVKFPTCTDAASCALAGVSLGLPGYYDVGGSHPNPTITPTPTVCEWSPSDNRRDAGPDAKVTSRLYRSGPAGSALNPDCVLRSGPGTCAITGGSPWAPNDNRDSAWTGRQTLTLINEGLTTTYFHGGTCQGKCTYGAGDSGQCPVGANASPGPSNLSSFASAPTYSTKTVTHASLVVNQPPLAPVTLNDVRFDSAAAGCVDNGDIAPIACSAKTPGCVDANYGLICTAIPPPGTNLTAFEFSGGDSAMVHDCLDDNGITDFNPGGSYIRSQSRTFGTGYNTNSSPADGTHSYSTAAGDAINSSPGVDMYSVNYLNWKYGPRGPNNLPIARKTRMQIAKDALATLVERTNGVRYGLMVFNGLPADAARRASEGSQGARVVFPVTRMGSSPTDTPDAGNRAELIKRIFAQEARAATPLTESVYEAMLYFSGRAPRFGTNAAISTNFGATSLIAQGGGNVADGADPNAVCTAVSAQCTAIGNYKSPMLNNPTPAAPASCQRNFMVLITDGNADRDRDANAQIKNTTWAQSGTVTISARTSIDSTQPDTTTDQFETGGVPYGPVSAADTAFDGGYVWLDELASFMNRADLSPGARIFTGDGGTDLIAGDQPVKLFTIGFAGVNSPVLTNSATGDFKTAESSAELVKALEAAVNNARTSNAIVATPTIPISASNRAENADDVYLSYFKPDTTRTWTGTVKKYKLGLHALDPGICGNDASGNPIQVCLTGQTDTCGVGCKNIEKRVTQGTPPVTTVSIDPASVSFWSSPAAPDGGQPDQGGTAFVLKNTTGQTPDTRRVYTHLSSQTNPVLTADVNKVLESNTTLTKCLLGDAAACANPATPTMSDTTRTTLINYIRGGDQGAASCTTPGTACSVWRNFAHAGVLHSSPTVVTYTATEQLMFYLSVDGLLHAVDTATGQEKWAFLVEEALPQLSALMANTSGRDPIQIADGSISFFHKDHNGDGIVNNLGGTDQVFLFFGLRRGGRAYYALDVTTSTSPVFKWKITNTEVCVGASACGASPYGRLGQTWSKPIVAKLHASAVVASGFPALVFSGGYDPNQDIDPAPAVGTDTMGNALFVVNMTDGSLVKEFSNGNVAGGMLSAIPSDPAVLNANLDSLGFVDRIYVGDVAANLYRFDVDNADVSAWTGKKLAVLSDASPPNRKIFFPPVVVKQSVTSSGGITQDFDSVYVGTGDREHPLNLEVRPGVPVSDKIFMVKDPDLGLTSDPAYVAVFPTDFVRLGLTSAAGVTVDDLQSAKGWSRDLDVGEKVTGSPSVFGDRVRFGSYIPEASNVCSTGGESRLSELNATTGDFTLTTATGLARFQQATSSTYLSGTITILRGGKYYTVTFAPGGGGGQKAPPVLPSDITAAPGLGRVYWYMEPEL